MSNEPDFMGTLMITLILQPSSSFHTKWRGNKHVTESNFSKVVAQKNKRERERIAETRMHMQAAIICCSLIFFNGIAVVYNINAFLDCSCMYALAIFKN